jgi:diguanylate cyclase
MVEVNDDSAGKAGGDGESSLRQRADRLTKELDWLEARHRQLGDVLRSAVTVLIGAGQGAMAPAVAEACLALKKAAASPKLDPKALNLALDRLKTSLLRAETEPAGAEPAGEARGEGVTAGGGAAGHVALAMLEGLRLGAPEFDAHLEQSIVLVGDYMQQGRVRPVMAVLADLLDHYRQELDRRRLAAEKALREVLEEVVTAESEITAFFSQTSSQISQASQDNEARLTHQMGRLAQDIGQATNLDQLKSTALDHIRALRDQIRNHRAQENEFLARTQAELGNLQATLENTRQRMAVVEQASQRLSQEALSDPLTGAPNKRALNLHLADLLHRPEMQPVCMMVFDIDHFKNINDSYGHQAGDRALKAIASKAGESLRQNDTLFRYAGDEFVIVLLRTELKDAQMVAERVRAAAESIRFTWKGSHELRITISLGLAQGQPGEKGDSLFERADQALLLAKRAGRNRVVTA